MSRIMKGEVTTAIRTLRRNRGRSLLTMLGIVIGVSSVVLVAAIGQGVEDQINQQTERLGSDLITIQPGEAQTSGNVLYNFNQLFQPGLSGALTENDIGLVEKTPGVATAVPLSVVAGGAISGETNRHADVVVIGTETAFPVMLKQSVKYGSFFDDSATAVNKVVLGSEAAQSLYDEAVPLGQTLSVLGHEFIVTGILNEFPSSPLASTADLNQAIFIPFSTARDITQDTAQVYEIFARPQQPSQASALVDRLNGVLLAAHGGQHNFSVIGQHQTAVVASNILDLLTVMVAVIAGIALLVGGVGIMNVTLVSVTERMHEVGIRKAVGATNGQILRQFVIEAAVLSIAGGVLGLVVAYAAELVIRVLTDLTPTVTWQAASVACLASVAVGITFGSVPALKAAHKDPIGALRGE